MTSRAGRLLVVTLGLAAGCGTQILEPEVPGSGGAAPDAAAVTPPPPPQPMLPGRNMDPSPGRRRDPGQRKPPRSTPDSMAMHCVTIDLRMTGTTVTCLACEPEGGPSDACTSCTWLNLPVTLTCSRCPPDRGRSPPDDCDRTLDEARRNL